jgi:nitroimidazol reductase NimA-like FMN-containing flavoprotein (pyridoxamine 5'-phosphate oxidase superfamily)
VAKYHMNRQDKEISERNGLLDIIRRGRYATIAMCRGNEPYVVTLNYGFDEDGNALYFHCALQGLKMDFIRSNANVCATVVQDMGYKTGECDQAYRSVVLWGTMHVVESPGEKKRAIEVLLNHLEDDPAEVRERSLKSNDAYEKVGVLRLDIEEMTGKQGG